MCVCVCVCVCVCSRVIINIDRQGYVWECHVWLGSCLQDRKYCNSLFLFLSTLRILIIIEDNFFFYIYHYLLRAAPSHYRYIYNNNKGSTKWSWRKNIDQTPSINNVVNEIKTHTIIQVDRQTDKIYEPLAKHIIMIIIIINYGNDCLWYLMIWLAGYSFLFLQVNTL